MEYKNVEVPTPNSYEIEILEKIEKSIQEGKNEFLVVAPSGLGKTYISAFATQNFKGKGLFLVHRKEIIDQAKPVFQIIHDIQKKDIGDFNNYKKQIDKKLIFAMVQTLGKHDNLNMISQTAFDYIIVDEAHHSPASSYDRILSYFKPKYKILMTATPYRMDGKDIYKYVDSNVLSAGEIMKHAKSDVLSAGKIIKDAILRDFLCDINYHFLWDDVDYSDIYYNGYKYKDKDLNKKLLIDKRDTQIIKEVKERMGSRKCVGFCCSVKHIKRCVDKFNKSGILSAGIHHKTEPEERQKIIKEFSKGNLQIIFTRDIFNEGVSFPEIEGLLFLRPTYSQTILYQQLGRGLRKKPGKKDVLVLDFVGNSPLTCKTMKWVKAVIPTEEEKLSKPEYSHSISKVNFDSKVVDFLELMEPVTEEKLIENYFKLKKSIGRQPRIKDFKTYKNIQRRSTDDSTD